ncbi:MAG: hypothetical protein SAJ12_13070 [Jaaginema sp. PMC 1079.18]|nr:hypothetical protein [Jaaginema sp. PMC 1080.18]MEC4851938.1 hypothetical protein [Jaaginema sp. PMC 1079.18]MEC4868416.1 hypothetical protein [Jaaginema sp. PMC 1078.18]
MTNIIWSEYFIYRVELRGFDLTTIEEILRFSGERYYDTETSRMIAVGQHNTRLVMVAYEIDNDTTTPVTIHEINRKKIRFRLRNGRFIPYGLS